MFNRPYTTSTELHQLAARDQIHLADIFSRDQIPRALQANAGYILNFDTSEGSGTHWTAFYIFSKRRVAYFDSFGQPPPEEFNHAFDGYQVTRNHKIIQNPASGWCGHYCLFFIYWCQTCGQRKNMAIAVIVRSFEDLFTSTPQKNLTLLKKYLGEIGGITK